MSNAPAYLGIGALVAFLAGGIRAFRITVPELLVGSGVPLPLSFTGFLAALAVLAFLVHPVTTATVGYLWGRRADVRSAYPNFVGLLGAAAVFGFVVTYLPVATLGGTILDPGTLLEDAGFSLGVLAVPLVALAGAAVGHFRGTDPAREPPSGTPDRDPAIDRLGTSVDADAGPDPAGRSGGDERETERDRATE